MAGVKAGSKEHDRGPNGGSLLLCPDMEVAGAWKSIETEEEHMTENKEDIWPETGEVTKPEGIRVFAEVVKEIFRGLPHRPIHDLMIIYYIPLAQDDEGIAPRSLMIPWWKHGALRKMWNPLWNQQGENDMLLVIDTNIIVNAIKSPNPQVKSVMVLRVRLLYKKIKNFQKTPFW